MEVTLVTNVVCPDHEESNYKMAAMLCCQKFRLRSNVIRIKGELDPVEAAHQCELALRKRASGNVSA